MCVCMCMQVCVMCVSCVCIWCMHVCVGVCQCRPTHTTEGYMLHRSDYAAIQGMQGVAISNKNGGTLFA